MRLSTCSRWKLSHAHSFLRCGSAFELAIFITSLARRRISLRWPLVYHANSLWLRNPRARDCALICRGSGGVSALSTGAHPFLARATCRASHIVPYCVVCLHIPLCPPLHPTSDFSKFSPLAAATSPQAHQRSPPRSDSRRACLPPFNHTSASQPSHRKRRRIGVR